MAARALHLVSLLHFLFLLPSTHALPPLLLPREKLPPAPLAPVPTGFRISRPDRQNQVIPTGQLFHFMYCLIEEGWVLHEVYPDTGIYQLGDPTFDWYLIYGIENSDRSWRSTDSIAWLAQRILEDCLQKMDDDSPNCKPPKSTYDVWAGGGTRVGHAVLVNKNRLGDPLGPSTSNSSFLVPALGSLSNGTSLGSARNLIMDNDDDDGDGDAQSDASDKPHRMQILFWNKVGGQQPIPRRQMILLIIEFLFTAIFKDSPTQLFSDHLRGTDRNYISEPLGNDVVMQVKFNHDVSVGVPIKLRSIGQAFRRMIQSLAEDDTWKPFSANFRYEDAPLFEYFLCVRINTKDYIMSTPCVMYTAPVPGIGEGNGTAANSVTANITAVNMTTIGGLRPMHLQADGASVQQ